MADELFFNLDFPNPDGTKTPIRFTMEGVRDFVVQMLLVAAQAPIAPDLERSVTLDDSPIPINGFLACPLESDRNSAHLAIGIGPLNLQFAVSLSALMAALEALREQTEPDPTSSHRPN